MLCSLRKNAEAEAALRRHRSGSCLKATDNLVRERQVLKQLPVNQMPRAQGRDVRRQQGAKSASQPGLVFVFLNLPAPTLHHLVKWKATLERPCKDPLAMSL